MTPLQIVNATIKVNSGTGALDTNQVSDGYHTFGELYEHRIELFITLCRVLAHADYSGKWHFETNPTWRSEKHSDDSKWEGWFILGIGDEEGMQITYHLPMSKWEQCNFAETLDKAPKWDGHTSGDVLERLKNI